MNVELLNYLEDYKFYNIRITNDDTLSGINAVVKKIYVINLLEDFRKRNYIYILFKKYKINYNLIVVDRIDKQIYDNLIKNNKISIAELGCCMSHMWCLLDMIKNKCENCIIFEDDTILSKDFTNSFLNIIKKQPNIDFLMLGAHDYNFSKIHFKNVRNNLYKPEKKCKKLYGAHANYYSNLCAEKMLSIRLANLSFFDNDYNLIFDSFPKSYICYPNLAIANVSESLIDHEKKFFSESEIGYYNLCFDNINLTNYNLIYTNLLDLSLLKKNDSVKSFLFRCFMSKFMDKNKSSYILKRCTFDFFTINDLVLILSNQSLIVPNILSKK
jgi:GR25 family glycosyltransferase involved in LPS biosynthesis